VDLRRHGYRAASHRYPVAGRWGRSSARSPKHVARLIPDQATIELGLGAIPETVTHALGGKRGLGVHSGAIGDGIADLMEAGIVDNRHKEIDLGITVATMLMGTRRPYRFADRNPSIRIHATSYTPMRWCSAISSTLLQSTGQSRSTLPDR
jgi:acyl-CoA hydrolase